MELLFHTIDINSSTVFDLKSFNFTPYVYELGLGK